jgi:hypothetical protein
LSEVRWGGALISSHSTLNKFRSQLLARYNATELGRDGQAIVVDFEDGERPVDVVPAAFIGIEEQGFATYWIPDGDAGWLKTSPEGHNRFIKQADERSLGKLKNVAKLVKYWRWCRISEIPLSSFYVEMSLAARDIWVGIKTYGECLSQLFSKLSIGQCASLRDPLHVSGLIRAAGTEWKRQRAAAAVMESAFHARRALDAEAEGKTDEAVRQWDSVFNGNFPKG